MTAPDQLTREHLKAMTPEQIVEARAQGRCDRILGVSEEEIELRAIARDPNAQMTTDTAVAMTRAGLHQAVAKASQEGRINYDIEENL